MNWKHLFALLLTLLCITLPAMAEEADAPEKIVYQGGVIYRVMPRDDPNAELINIAYLRCDKPYVIVGEEVNYTVVLSGGVPPYQVNIGIACRPVYDDDAGYEWYAYPTNIKGTSFTQRFTKLAEYFFEIKVSDSKGQSLKFQSRPFYSHSTDEETDATTIAGKVNQIVSEVITPEMSDYSKAKALHDWLIFNANYDHTYTYYGPEGVLLYGAGVCDSYTRAYQKLLTAAGLQSITVTGYAGGYHAWNMVLLDGKWYHVDCTWDDPGAGGAERWDYFCITDEQMSKDHTWNQENTPSSGDYVITPETPKDEEPAPSSGPDLTFTELAEVKAWYEEMAANGPYREHVNIKYAGPVEQWEVIKEAYYDWFWPARSRLGFTSFNTLTWSDYRFTADLRWHEERANYIKLETDELVLDLGAQQPIVIDTLYPESSTVTWTSSDPMVATVSSSGVVTAVGSGEAVISATVPSGDTQEVLVTVMVPHQPDFGLTLTENSSGVRLTWNSIPGVTRYRVMRKVGKTETELASTADLYAELSATLLPADELSQVYIIAERVVAGQVQLSYTSRVLEFGEVNIRYSLYIPAGITEIGASAFAGSGIGNVHLPDSVAAIGASAFADCAGMTAIRIPASVLISADAFRGTPLQYAVVAPDSSAHAWFASNMPDVLLIFE